jgi:hypothetical protein
LILVLLAACSQVYGQVGPLSDSDTIDDVGVLKDGGIDLVIACSGRLDDSDETVNLLSLKVRNYARLAADRSLFAHYHAKDGAVRIFVSCDHPVSLRVKRELDTLRNELSRTKIQLLLVRRMTKP